MLLDLPKTRRRLLHCRQGGTARAVSQCFTETAVVTDEGHTYHGRAAIQAMESGGLDPSTSTRANPFACDHKDGKVRRHQPAHRQPFPGSPP